MSALYIACLLVNLITTRKDTGDKRRAIRDATKTVFEIGAITVSAVILFTSFFSINFVPSASMEPTVMTGDVVVSNRYNLDSVSRYDIVVFKYPDDPDILYIKRVIGLPGETITVENGMVYADGVPLNNKFIAEEMDSSGDGTFVVPEDSYFMMGDNRNNSLDSRFWVNTYVPKDYIIGKAELVILPLREIQILKGSTYWGNR